jgi:hypothetical protein
MRFVIVWLLPVPGGPWITLLWPARTDAIALCWLESASRTENSLSGGMASNSFGSGSFCPVFISVFASPSPAIAAITECVAKSLARSCRSFTIAIF